MENVRFSSTRTLFHPDIKVTAVYLHNTRDGQQQDVKKRESGWVSQGVISRASFRRLPCNGKSFYTTMSLHINNQFAEKRGVWKKLLLTIRAMMLEEHVDFVAGDFNGAAWRRPCGNHRKLTSIIEEAFANTDLPIPPGTTPWADECGFLKTPDSHEKWKVRLHGACSIHPSTMGLREKDQSSHHEVWMHLALTDPRGDYAPRNEHDQRLHLKERSDPYPTQQESRAHGEQGDHSRSS